MKSNKKIKLLYFYPELLNLYGDRGNVEIFISRSLSREIEVEVKEVRLGEKLNLKDFKEADFIFMGGGSDLNQKALYEDLIKNKKGFLVDFIASNKAGLFICGAYQLLGNYYETENGQKIDGLGICNFYTKNEGKDLRSVGKIKLELAGNLDETSFKTNESKFLYGFENHGGHTYFEEKLDPLGKVIYGYGNDRKSKTEGLVFRGIVGTYLHGPVFSLNPEFCDFFIKKVSGENNFKKLDDSLILQAREFLK